MDWIGSLDLDDAQARTVQTLTVEPGDTAAEPLAGDQDGSRQLTEAREAFRKPALLAGSSRQDDRRAGEVRQAREHERLPTVLPA